jgi:hypothetical protein
LKRHTILFICGFFLLSALPAFAATPDRIFENLQDGRTFQLVGNTHRLAVPSADVGPAPASFVLPRISIHFKMTDAQQIELNRLLEDQQNPASPLYHQWLTPEEFGQRFGLSQADLDKVIAWLESSGFSNVEVNHSRTEVSMSGSVGLAQSVFGTPIHYYRDYRAPGATHYANASNPSLPRALEGMVAAIRGLNDFHPRPHLVSRRVPDPRFTSSITGLHFLAPADFATIYNVQALYNSGFTGSGQTIAIPGQVSISVSNVQTFRSLSGLPANNPQIVQVGTPGSDSGDQTESYLDLEWAGAVAPKATIVFVTSGDAFTSVNYIIDNNLAPVLSITYGDCESQFGDAQLNAENDDFQQANAQGMTILAASGDSGAADCDTGDTATQGLAVDFPASSPYVTGAGGLEFNEGTGTYWSSTDNAQNGSALSYIPEKVWNDTTSGNPLSAGGGGRSSVFAKPVWQQGYGVPNDGVRDVPDVAFNASPNHDAYLICGNGDCGNGFRVSMKDLDLDTVGGTSAAAPVLAGIIALLDQRMGTSQGNINPALYRLAASSSDAFHDVTVGNNIVPCNSGTANCPASGQMGYSATPGFDLASGWGSLNAFNFVNEWNGAISIRSVTEVSASLSQVSVGADGTAWGIDSSGNIFAYNAETQNWQQVPGSLAEISVGASGDIWGINSFGSIYRYDSSSQGWIYVPGALAHISVGADGDVWGLNSAGSIYRFDSASQGWDQIPGSLARIAVGYDGAVWGINSGGAIYRYNPGTKSFQWTAGSLSQIAVGADGDAWGINSTNQTFRFDSFTQSWQHISGTLQQVSVGSAFNVWALDSSGSIYTFNNGTQLWNAIAGNLAQISAGANGTVWGVDSASRTFHFVQSTQPTQTFHYVPGALVQVAVSSDGDVWGLNSAGEIYYFNRLTQSWTWVPGQLAQISIARNGSVWGINPGGSIYTFNPSTQSWVWTPGELKQIAVADTGDVWGLNSEDSIYRYNPATRSWSEVPGSLAQIAVGSDGAVWGINSEGSVYAYNAQNNSWYQAPGNFARIAVGSGANVWALDGAGNVFRYNSQAQNWAQTPGNLAQISVGFDGGAWGLDSSGDILRFDATSQNWTQLSGQLSTIAVSSDAIVWGLNSGQSIYRFY